MSDEDVDMIQTWDGENELSIQSNGLPPHLLQQFVQFVRTSPEFNVPHVTVCEHTALRAIGLTRLLVKIDHGILAAGDRLMLGGTFLGVVSQISNGIAKLDRVAAPCTASIELHTPGSPVGQTLNAGTRLKIVSSTQTADSNSASS